MSEKNGHSHAPKNYNRAFAIGVGLNLVFVVVEAVFGLLSDSLALLADAGHNLSDVISLILAWGAGRLGELKPSKRHTYGWKSSTILAALMNALLLLAAIGAIAWEAIQRLSEPHPVAGATIIVVAAVGVVINSLTALLFMSGRKADLNIKGAFLHMAADAGVSFGVIIAGAAIWATGILWLDPAVSLAIAIIIFIGTWGLLKDSVNLALHAVPKDIDVDGIYRYLQNLPGVQSVHDLHIWALSTWETALTVHLVKPDPRGNDEIISQAARELKGRFGIDHTTIQLEHGSDRNCIQKCNGD